MADSRCSPRRNGHISISASEREPITVGPCSRHPRNADQLAVATTTAVKLCLEVLYDYQPRRPCRLVATACRTRRRFQTSTVVYLRRREREQLYRSRATAGIVRRTRRLLCGAGFRRVRLHR